MSERADYFLTLLEVVERSSLKKSTIYLWMARGDFPKQIHLSPGCSRWSARDIDEWMEKARTASPDAPKKRRGRPPKNSSLRA